MKKVEKKVWPEYFEEIIKNKKTFELRLNDFDINEGDILVLKEWNPETKNYTGRELEKVVGYVGKWKVDELTKFWPHEDIDKNGIQIISLKSEIPKTFYRLSIKALILNESRDKFLVILEDNGWWELPGGGLDWPEKPEECLKREIKEEMGIDVTEINPNPSYFLVGENMKGNRSVNIVLETKLKDLNFIPSNECVELKFVSPEEVESMNAFRNVKELALLLNSSKKESLAFH